jgi:hypothetical protein
MPYTHDIEGILSRQLKTASDYNRTMYDNTLDEYKGVYNEAKSITVQQLLVLLYIVDISLGRIIYEENEFDKVVQDAIQNGGLNFWWYGFTAVEELSRQSLIRFIYGCYKAKCQEDKVKKEGLISIVTFLIKNGYKGNADDAHVCGAHCSEPTFGLDVAAKFEKTDDVEAYEAWVTESSENFVNNFYDENDYLKPF